MILAILISIVATPILVYMLNIKYKETFSQMTRIIVKEANKKQDSLNIDKSSTVDPIPCDVVFTNKLDSFPEKGSYLVCIGTKDGYRVVSSYASKTEALMARDHLFFTPSIFNDDSRHVFITQEEKK